MGAASWPALLGVDDGDGRRASPAGGGDGTTLTATYGRIERAGTGRVESVAISGMTTTIAKRQTCAARERGTVYHFRLVRRREHTTS
jgi:hypothetical protein